MQSVSQGFVTSGAIAPGRGNIPSVNKAQRNSFSGQQAKQPPVAAQIHRNTIAHMSANNSNQEFTVSMSTDNINQPNDMPSITGLNQNYKPSASNYTFPQVDETKTPTYDMKAAINQSYTATPDVPSYATGSGSSYGFGGINANTYNASRSKVVMQASETTSADVVAADAGANEKEELAKKFKPAYAYFVLFIVLACRIMVQWHRKGLTYAYGYTGLGIAAGNGLYEISTAFPQLKQWYGLLAGLIYTIPYASFGLIAGKISDQVNRKVFLAIVIALASLTMGVSGFTTSFFVFSAMRVLHGMFNSSSNPLSFSLIADYFPPDKRSTANSIIQAGNYIGVGVSSLSILLISKFGWRVCYSIMGATGLAFSLATLLFVKEPERGRFMDAAAKQKEAEKKAAAEEAAKNSPKNPVKAFVDNLGVVFTLPCARNVLMASSLRNFGGMIVSSFLPVFFGKNFPAFKAEYALLNAAALSICGFVASLSGGILADKFEKKSYWTKAIICMFGCAISVPLIALGTLSTANFYLSVACYALKVLFSGTYSGPAITMIQNTSPQSQQGNVVSVYFFCITVAQTLSPAIFGYFANMFGCLTNPAMYGPLITSAVAFGYLGSLPFWFNAGKAYKKHMEEKDAEEANKLIQGA